MSVQKRKPFIFKSRFYNNLQEKKTSSIAKKFFSLLQEAKYIHHGFKQFNKHGVQDTIKLDFNNIYHDGIWWLGHATFLIKLSGMVIITDPVFGSLPFLKRLSELPLLSHNIPRVDYVLISHNHWDHLCLKTIDKLYKVNNKLKICAPHGDARHFKKYQNCIEHNWWESSIFERLKITFLPTNHWSQTNLLDRNRSLWGSWLIEAGKKIYFGGDSSYDTHYEEIGNHYSDIDYALLPIGPCEPRKMMSKSHMGPEESIKAFQDLKAKFLVPMHWGTFSFGLDDRHTALERLKNSAHQNLEKIKILSVGQNIIL